MPQKPLTFEDWEKFYAKEKEENATKAVEGLDLPPQVIDAVKVWWRNTESTVEFQGYPASLKNRRRKEFYDWTITNFNLDEDQAKKLEKFHKPSFLRSLKWAALEALPPIAELIPEEPPGIRKHLGLKPAIKPRAFERPEEVARLPMHPVGEIVGGMAGELPALLGSFKLADIAARKGMPLLRAAGVVGRTARGATGFGLPEVPKVATGKEHWTELAKGTILGAAGMGPARPLTAAIAAGTVATVMEGRKGARFTGIPIIDVGLPTALMFGAFKKLELKTESRLAQKESPRQQLARELEGYVEKQQMRPKDIKIAATDDWRAAMLKEQQQMASEHLLQVNKAEAEAVQSLRGLGQMEAAVEVNKAAQEMRDAMASGMEQVMNRAATKFEKVIAATEDVLAQARAIQLKTGHINVYVTNKGSRMIEGELPAGGQTREALARIDKKPFTIEQDKVLTLSDAKGKKNFSPLDEYIAERMIGHDRPFNERELESVFGYNRRTFPEFIRELRSGGALDVTMGKVEVAWQKRLTEIKNSGLPPDQKKKLIYELEQEIGARESAAVIAGRRETAVKPGAEADYAVFTWEPHGYVITMKPRMGVKAPPGKSDIKVVVNKHTGEVDIRFGERALDFYRIPLEQRRQMGLTREKIESKIMTRVHQARLKEDPRFYVKEELKPFSGQGYMEEALAPPAPLRKWQEQLKPVGEYEQIAERLDLPVNEARAAEKALRNLDVEMRGKVAQMTEEQLSGAMKKLKREAAKAKVDKVKDPAGYQWYDDVMNKPEFLEDFMKNRGAWQKLRSDEAVARMAIDDPKITSMGKHTFLEKADQYFEGRARDYVGKNEKVMRPPEQALLKAKREAETMRLKSLAELDTILGARQEGIAYIAYPKFSKKKLLLSRSKGGVFNAATTEAEAREFWAREWYAAGKKEPVDIVKMKYKRGDVYEVAEGVYPDALPTGHGRGRWLKLKSYQSAERVGTEPETLKPKAAKPTRRVEPEKEELKLDWTDLDEKTTRSIAEVGAGISREADPSDPIYIARLFERAGREGAWESTLGELKIKDPTTKKFMPITFEQLEKLPQAGDITKAGELIITTRTGNKFAVVMRRDGSMHIVDKTGISMTPSAGYKEPLTYEQVKQMMWANKGFIAEFKTPDGGIHFRDVITGKRATMTAEEARNFARSVGSGEDLSPGIWNLIDLGSYDVKSIRMPMTDGIPRRVAIGRAIAEAAEMGPLRMVTPPKALFSRYQNVYKIPIADTWRGVEEALRPVRMWQKKFYPKMRNFQKHIKEMDEDALLHYIKTERPQRPQIAEQYGFGSKELRAVESAEGFLAETFGPEWREFLTNYIPDAVASGIAPDALKAWTSHGFVPQTPHLYDMLVNAAHTKMRLTVAPYLARFQEIRRLVSQSELMHQTRRKVLDDINLYEGRIWSSLSGDHRTTSDFFSTLSEILGQKITGSLGDDVISSFLLLSYSGTMPFRLGLALRNLTQTLTTTSLYMGPSWWASGVKRTFSRKGLLLAKELGYTEFTGVAMEHILPRSALGLRKAYNLGMLAFRGADGVNRAISANAAYSAMEKIAPKFMQGKIPLQQLKRSTGLIYLDKASQQQVLSALSDGNLVTAAKRFAVHMAEDTQWLYRAGNSPRIFRSKLGRFVGQYGVWPTNFLRFFIRGVTTGDAAATEAFIARWLLVNGALSAAGNQVLGIDVRPWLFSGPFSYMGGPGASVLHDAYDFQQGGYRRESALRSLKRTMFTLVPFGYALRDRARAFEEWQAGEKTEAIKRYIGFRSYPPDR